MDRTPQKSGFQGSGREERLPDLARHRYWQGQGLTFDQAADAWYFEVTGTGPWQGSRVTEIRQLWEMAGYLADTYRRTPQGARYPIEVRKEKGFPCGGPRRWESLAEKKLRVAKELRDVMPREPRLNN
jgi:hypothetical protein